MRVGQATASFEDGLIILERSQQLAADLISTVAANPVQGTAFTSPNQAKYQRNKKPMNSNSKVIAIQISAVPDVSYNSG
jgi:hypothetical protein